jgi:hypothetical protein
VPGKGETAIPTLWLMRRVWVQAFERSQKMPKYGYKLLSIQPPVNHQLEGTASWINMPHGLDGELPKGWVNTTSISIIWPEGEQETRNIWILNSKQAAG